MYMSKYLRNKKATFNYEIVDTMSAGIQLQGFEVKAIKKNVGGSLEGSYVIIKDGEAFLVGAHIPEYQSGNTPSGYDSRRPRKLLLTKKELNMIIKTINIVAAYKLNDYDVAIQLYEGIIDRDPGHPLRGYLNKVIDAFNQLNEKGIMVSDQK